jgi:hypothetical protein
MFFWQQSTPKPERVYIGRRSRDSSTGSSGSLGSDGSTSDQALHPGIAALQHHFSQPWLILFVLVSSWERSCSLLALLFYSGGVSHWQKSDWWWIVWKIYLLQLFVNVIRVINQLDAVSACYGEMCSANLICVQGSVPNSQQYPVQTARLLAKPSNCWLHVSALGRI